jgi:hypothetical protein
MSPPPRRGSRIAEEAVAAVAIAVAVVGIVEVGATVGSRKETLSGKSVLFRFDAYQRQSKAARR